MKHLVWINAVGCAFVIVTAVAELWLFVDGSPQWRWIWLPQVLWLVYVATEFLSTARSCLRLETLHRATMHHLQRMKAAAATDDEIAFSHHHEQIEAVMDARRREIEGFTTGPRKRAPCPAPETPP